MKKYVVSIEAELDDIEADNRDEAQEKFMDWFDQVDLIDFVEVEEIEKENTAFKIHCPKCGFLNYFVVTKEEVKNNYYMSCDNPECQTKYPSSRWLSEREEQNETVASQKIQ